MPPFPKPSFPIPVDVATEIQALQQYRNTKPGRAIPAKADGQLLLATWNIANLGVQERRVEDYQLIAELLSWFDLIAVQEVNDNLAGLRAIQAFLPVSYRALFSDAAGNHERLAFLYDSQKITLGEKIGEVAIPPSQLRHLRLPDSELRFDGFDRTPYIASFQSADLRFMIANVHLYFGSEATIAINRRRLETMAVARWADLRRRSPYAYAPIIIAIGDFNLPKAQPGDPIFKALTERGLQLPKHTSEIGSTLVNDSHYDQIAFFPKSTQAWYTGLTGVFDFDGAVFSHVWQSRTPEEFRAAVRYYLSDHRILWTQFRTRLLP